MRILSRAFLLLALLSPLSSPATAGTLADVTMPDKIDVQGQSLVLNGMGLRKKLVIKVYVGSLYLPAKESSAAKILAADSPRRMVMSFLFGVSKSQMCDAWKEGLADNSPKASDEVKKGFATLCSWMEDIDSGKSLVLTYLPGQGTQVEVNGKSKGTIPGKAVSDAALATWIGPDPGPGADFKQAVLGGK